MNDKFHNYVKKAGQEVSLTPEERERMRHALHAYMEMRPVRTPSSSQFAVPRFGWIFSPRSVAALLVVALFASSAGISFAAEDSLPGDILYPVKTDVNEPIQGALALSASAKTTWAMNVAGERIQEAATLAAEGRLGTTTQQELQENFQQHAQLATAGIEQQATSSPEASAATAVRFEAQLSEYQNVLAQIAATKNVDVSSLANVLRVEHDHLAVAQARAEAGIASMGKEGTAAADMQVAASDDLQNSKDLANSASESLSSSSAQLISAQLVSASTTISAGEDFTAKHATPDALGAFQSALTTSEELGVFLQTSSDIHAHTGLIVGQPQNEQSRNKTQSSNKTDRRNTSNGQTRTSATSTSATSTSASSSSISQSSQVAATTTGGDQDQNNGSATGTSVQTQVEEQGQIETPSAPTTPSVPVVPTLPISVPVHISL